jgi:hypothetical protein
MVLLLVLEHTYTSNDYSPFNLVGGTNSVTGDITAGQGFLLGVCFRGTATFKSMRLNPYGEIVNNSSFKSLRLVRKRQKQQQPKQRAGWLNLTNTQGAFKQLLLGYA